MINSLLIYCLIPELKITLENSRISEVKITLDKKGLILSLRKQNKRDYLFLSIHPQNYRVELLTSKELQKIEFEPTSIFPSLSRAILKKIEQPNFDRVINFYFIRKTQFNKTRIYRLIAELTGRNSNLILVDDQNNKILGFLRGVGATQSKFRQIKTGIEYVPPPLPRRLNPLTINQAQFKELLMQNNQTNLFEFLINQFNSIDFLLAKKIIQQVKINPQKKIKDLTSPEIDSLSESFVSIFVDLTQGKLNPQIIFDKQKLPIGISVFSLPFIPKNQKRICPTINYAIKIFFQIKKQESDRADLYGIVSRQIAKLETREERLQQDFKKAKRYEEFKKFGDLLIANAHRLKKGETQVKLADLFDQKQKSITIPLDPSLGPIENARTYFKKFKKGKAGIKIIKNRLELTEQEKGKLTSLSSELGKGLSSEQLDKIKIQLGGTGYLPKAKRETKKNKGKLLPREFMTLDGFKILVGRNNKENDYLSFKLAKKDDLWFHTDRFAGSHVLLLRADRKTEFSQKSITKAAALAAYFSKARNSKKASVIYTLAKYVKKPKGAKPGLVTVSREKNIIVEPKLTK